jgi:hypothetical protein
MTSTITLPNGRTFNVVDYSRPRNDAAAPAIAASKKKPHKYGARSVVIDGIRFPSKREGERWLALRLRVVLGEIADLERQVSYQLAPSVRIQGEKRARPALRFTADFRYIEGGQTVVEDAKGFADTAFRIRQHLMKSVHGIDVRLS